VEQNPDPRKRPILTPEQLRKIRGIPETIRKGTPRQEFEKLFRLSTPASD
jgi:hypothetical protein